MIHSAACDKDEPIDWFSAEIKGVTEGQGSIYQHSDFYKKTFPFVNQAETPSQLPGSRLDTLCAGLVITTIDLLHIDIEGAEFVALSGMGDLRPKMIFLEVQKKYFKSGVDIKDTEPLLAHLGYELALNLGIDRVYLHRSVL